MAFNIKDLGTLKGGKPAGAMPTLVEVVAKPTPLTWFERLSAWLTVKESLYAQAKQDRARVHAMMMTKDEVLSRALLFENADITRWLENVANTDKGALAVQLKQLKEENKELTKRLAKLGPSERIAWEHIDAILEAWECASGVRTAHWDKDKKEWVPDIRLAMLPQDVIDGIRAWINRPKT